LTVTYIVFIFTSHKRVGAGVHKNCFRERIATGGKAAFAMTSLNFCALL